MATFKKFLPIQGRIERFAAQLRDAPSGTLAALRLRYLGAGLLGALRIALRKPEPRVHA